ncbi:MAG: acetylxylan esterase [Acidobacteria bacterium]|nr:acetylxylan esterase [Acidobacteriota bacterium]
MSFLKYLSCLAIGACLLTVTRPSLAAATIGHPTSNAADIERTPPQEAFRVLPQPDSEGPQITPYLLYQTSLAWQQNEQRQTRWAQVKTESDLAQLRAELRQSVLEMIGGLPTEKTGLHATVTGRVQGEGFHIEKLIYQSLPGYYVTALVYVPEDGAKIHPAVLVAAGHSPQGKFHYQDLSQRLVKRGYLVISWDPVGQGERSQFWDKTANRSRYNLICAEHAVMGNLAYLAGASLARWEIWDGMRAVDYLLSRPDVDGQRISLTGTSGGGFQAALLGALDERIKVIIPSCYITALAMRVENRIFVDPDSDPEQDLYGFLSKGVDHAGLLLMMYPRAVMVATAALDFFPVQGAHQSYTEVRSFYERFGDARKIGFAESYNTHQFSLKNQEQAIAFLDRFNGMPPRRGLPAVSLFSEADLRVTKSGQVSVDLPDAQPLLHFIAAYSAQRLPSSTRTLAQMYRSEHDPRIDTWSIARYEGDASPSQLRWENIGVTTVGPVHIDRYLLHHSAYLAMPLLHFHKGDRSAKGPLLWLNIEGKADSHDWTELTRFLDQGYDIYSFDFRGLGETRMNYRASSSDDPGLVKGTLDQAYVSPLSSVMADYVYNSLLTGRPYFLQMMDDIEIASLFIRHKGNDIRPLTIAAPDNTYPLAMRFQEIDPTVKLLPSASGSRLDWTSLVAHGQEQWPIVFLMPFGSALR